MEAADLVRRVCETYRTQRAMGGTRIPRPLATIVRSEERPRVWDANHASGVTATTPSEIDAVLAALEDAMQHVAVRKVFCDPFTPQPFVARLAVEGFARSGTVQLVLEGELRATPQELPIRRVESESDWASVADLLRESLDEDTRAAGREPPPESFVAQMAGMRREMAGAMHTWLARDDGADCGYFSSWSGVGGLGMVEWLFTRADHRRRGIATALIAHAVADARARGAGPVLIGGSDGDDAVPRRLYASLGFRPVCVTEEYTRPA